VPRKSFRVPQIRQLWLTQSRVLTLSVFPFWFQIVLAVVLTVVAAAPKPGYLHAPAIAYAAPAIHAAPLAYAAPVVAAPVVKAYAAPVVAAPLLKAYAQPLAYHGLYGGHYL
jgi:hypothetical protein